MPLQIIRGDITQVRCDAIVNAANETLLGGGGVDGAIHRAAGPELLEACRLLGGCKTGEAKLTPGFRLPCRYVIHTVGPIWNGGGYGEKELLESCYRNSLLLASEQGCESVAFPLISSGVYGYPKAEAVRVAVDTIDAFLAEHELLVYLVIFGASDFRLDPELQADLDACLDMGDTSALPVERKARRPRPQAKACMPAPKDEEDTVLGSFVEDPGLVEYLHQQDESFSQALLRKIDEKGMTDVECYKKANIDRKLFSKIRSDVHYRPKKPTALAFAIALELSREETEDLLRKAGFALSRSSTFDLIVEYFIAKGNYRIHEINEALFAYDQCLLGG